MHITHILLVQWCWVEAMLLTDPSFTGGVHKALCKKKTRQIQGDLGGKVKEKELLMFSIPKE